MAGCCASEPELAGAAVEEALRYEPITPFTARILTEEVVYRDVIFPEDTVVMVCAFTGNRDLDEDGGATAGDSDRFDITADRGQARARSPSAPACTTASARTSRALELQEGLVFLAERLRELALDGEPVFEGVSGIYGLDELPMRFTAAGQRGRGASLAPGEPRRASSRAVAVGRKQRLRNGARWTFQGGGMRPLHSTYRHE